MVHMLLGYIVCVYARVFALIEHNECVTCGFTICIIIITLYYDNNQQHSHELVSTTNQIRFIIYSASEGRILYAFCLLHYLLFAIFFRETMYDIKLCVSQTVTHAAQL